MLKKSLLSLAVAASLGVSGCNISSTSGNADADSVKPSGDAGVYPIFNPADGVLPNGIDLVFAAQASDLVPESMKDGTVFQPHLNIEQKTFVIDRKLHSARVKNSYTRKDCYLCLRESIH